MDRFLTYLATDRRVSASTQNQDLCALLFPYKQVLGLELGWVDGVAWLAKLQRRDPSLRSSSFPRPPRPPEVPRDWDLKVRAS